MKTTSYEQVSDFILESLILLVVVALCSLNVTNPLMATAVFRLLLAMVVLLIVFLTAIDHDTPFQITGWLSDHWRFMFLVVAVVLIFSLIPHLAMPFHPIVW